MSEVEDREPEVGRELHKAMIVVKIFKIPISCQPICYEILFSLGWAPYWSADSTIDLFNLKLSVTAVDGDVDHLLAC